MQQTGHQDRQVEIVLPRLGVKGSRLKCLVTIGFLALVPTGVDVAMPSGGPQAFLQQV